MRAYLMRGAPGSGKSRWVEERKRMFWANGEGFQVISCDDFFINEDGKYVFDPTMLPEYHNRCLRLYLGFLRCQVSNLIVDNTNLKVFELAPYYRLAEVFGYHPEVIWLHSTPEKCKERCVHGVPPDLIDKMLLGAEPLPSWWNVKIVPNF